MTKKNNDSLVYVKPGLVAQIIIKCESNHSPLCEFNLDCKVGRSIIKTSVGRAPCSQE